MYVDLNAVLRFKIMKCSKNTKKKKKKDEKQRTKKQKNYKKELNLKKFCYCLC